MRIFGVLASVLVITALSVLLLEFIGQKLLFRGQIYIVDDVDHRLQPNRKQKINSDGIRSAVEAEHFQENHHNIVFLGDSFVFGWKLPIEDTVPALLQKKARESMPDRQVNVANFGWASSSPLLSYRLLRDIGHKYKPDVVILAVDMTDFHDDIKYARLLERRGIYPLLDYTPATLIVLRKLMVGLGLESLIVLANSVTSNWTQSSCCLSFHARSSTATENRPTAGSRAGMKISALIRRNPFAISKKWHSRRITRCFPCYRPSRTPLCSPPRLKMTRTGMKRAVESPRMQSTKRACRRGVLTDSGPACRPA